MRWLGLTIAPLCCLWACQMPDPGLSTTASPLAGQQSKSVATAPVPPPLVDLRLRHPRIEGRLQDLADHCVNTDEAACARRAEAMGAELMQGRLRVQADVRSGLLATALDRLALAAAGANIETLGRDVADLLVPPGALISLAETDASIAYLQLPQKPHHFVGAELSQGVDLTRAASYHCTGNTGVGVDVAVVDTGFAGLNQAIATGDLPSDVTLMPGKQDPEQKHGTLCLEVVADMAPGASLRAVPSATFAQLQKFSWKQLPSMGVEVFSHSVGWFGHGFGDNSGKICALAEHVRAAGVALVAAAGNGGHKRFWRGTFTDADKNGWHEFAGDDIHNRMVMLPGQKYRVVLDWDEYPAAKTDLDLYLCRMIAGECQQMDKSNSTQNGKQPPVETLMGNVVDAGFYSVAIHRKGGNGAPAMRLHLLDGGAMKYHQKAGSVGEPASCTAAMAVAAASWDDWDEDVLADYSAHGPTEDGRIKPDIAAPSSVKTSLGGSFSGTSAACPHVAGAVALYMAATPMDAEQAMSRLLADASPAGPAGLDAGWGHGRLQLDADLSGATCHPGEAVACPTACATTGTVVCAPGCLAGTCIAPKEKCNGADDDCNGQTDESYDCIRDATKSCEASCGAPGVANCMANCKWSACQPATEEDPCDGVDNNCDGQTDEDATCAPGAQRSCTTACDSHGLQTCGNACSYGACAPLSEVCNGSDDDCDGSTDEGFSCPVGYEGKCKTACGSTGLRMCQEDCSWAACVVPAETCNDKDDDCDGAVDEDLECGGCSAARVPLGGAPSVGLLMMLALVLAVLMRSRYFARSEGSS